MECLEGESSIETIFEPRPEYARRPTSLHDAGPLGLRLQIGADVLTLRTEMPLRADASGCASGKIRLRAGDRLHFSLSYAREWPAVLPPVGPWTHDALARSTEWWKEWSEKLSYTGPF